MGQNFSLFRGGRAKRTGEPIPFGRASESANGVLELASGDGEPASLSRLNLVGVGNAFGGQKRLSRRRAALLISDPVPHHIFDHVKDFILVMVDVQAGEFPCEARRSRTEIPSGLSRSETRMVT